MKKLKNKAWALLFACLSVATAQAQKTSYDME